MSATKKKKKEKPIPHHHHGEGCGCSHESATVVRKGAKIGRNDKCPCGSGKKYKKCCMA